jgi:DNA mismatch endonuclease, patch repair protein
MTRQSASIARPPASSAVIRVRMENQRRRDTDAELQLRRELWRRGLRYRVNAALPYLRRRRADLIFPGARVAVFVDGCFWHGCPEHGTLPKANRAWWQAKLQSNRVRDADTDQVLRAGEWCPVRVWEHEDVRLAADRVERLVRDRRSRSHCRGGPRP